MERIVFTVADTQLACETRPDLFSPKGLDKGSELLLQQLGEVDFRRALDWGCGWGALGLWLAKYRPTGMVTLVDSDLSAVKAAAENIIYNKTPNALALNSTGFDEIPAEYSVFDLIVSNPPTHRGRAAVEDMISQSHDHLEEGGHLVIVVEARLKPWVKRAMQETFENVTVLARTNKHVVLQSSLT